MNTDQKKGSTALTVFGLIEIIFCIVGIIAFFSHALPIVLLYVAAVISVIYSVLNVIFGDQNSLGTEVIEVIAGIVIAYIFHLSILNGIALLLCIGSAGMLLLGWIIMLIIMLFR